MPQDPFDDIVKGYDQQFAPPKVKPVKPPKPPSFDDLVKDVDGQVGSASTPKAQRRQAIAGLQDELAQTTRQVKPGETRNLVTGQTYPTVTPKFQSPIDMRLNAPNEAQKAFDRAAAATGQQPAAPKPRNAFQSPRPKPILERVMAQQAIERQQPQTVETDPQRMEQVRQATAQQLTTQRQVRQVQAREDVAQMNPLQRMAVRGMAKAGGATNADLAETMPVSGVESTLGQFGQGAITTAARIPEGMERLGQLLPNVFDPFRANAKLRESQRQAGQNTLLTSGITKAGDAFADTVAPIDKTDEGFLTAKLPRGLGSTVPFIASSALGGGMPAAAALGAAINAQQTGEDLDRMGVQDEATRQKATAVAGLIGTLEAFGIEGRLGKVFGGQGGVLKRLLGAGGEGLQEWTTEELNDINAKLIAAYDPNRSIDPFQRKQLEAAALGALTGGLFEAGGGIAQAAQQRPITQARQAIDARSAANAAAIAPQAQPITEPLTEPLTAPVQAAPVASGRSQDLRRRGAQLLGEEIEEAAPGTPATPQAAPVVQPAAQPAPEPTVTGALRAEADAAKIEAGELEQAGDFANAVNAYDAAHKNLKLLRRRLGTPKTPEDVSLINQIDREISLAATNRQKAKEQARGIARQANKPTVGLPKQSLGNAEKIPSQVTTPQPAESAPLLRPDAVQNPEGGVPQMPEPSFTDRLEAAARRDASARGKAKPAKRLLSRIAELGGISDRYAGELQDVKDARRIGVIRQKAEMSPDVLARQLQSEGYDVDPEDLNTLWEAARRDIAGRDERTSQTSELERRLAEEEAAYNERQPFDQIVADVDAEPTNRLRDAEYEGGEVQRYSKPLEGQAVEEGSAEEQRQRATHPLVRLPLKMGEVGIKESDVDSILTLVNKYDELKDIAPNVQSVGNALAIAAQQNAIIRRLDGFAQQYPDIKNEIEYALFGEWDSEPQAVEREAFQPDTADLREVREFGKREPRTEQFTEEPPTAPLARRRQPIRPPAPASPRPVGNRPLSVDVAGTRTPTAMSPDFPRARREMVKQGREVDARLEMGQEKGDFGNVAEAMFKSNTPDVLHGQDSFFHDPDVKGKLGLTRDAEMADVRRELKTQLAKSLNLSVDEISLSHIKPEVWRAWAKQKGLGREAVRKLEAGIARAERKQRAVETNAQIVAEESQRAQSEVRQPAAEAGKVPANRAELEAERKEIQNKLDAQFWAFTRQKNAQPPDPALSRRMHEIEVELGIKKEFWQRTQSQVKNALRMPAEKHRQYVEKAIAEGKNVPAEVLADYPDLQKKPAAKAGKSIDAQIKDIRDLQAFDLIDDKEAKRKIAALEAQRPKIAERREAQPRTREDVENSPEFKRWFGDSKVVDENGKPLVVYHGTQSPNPITSVDFSKLDPDALFGPGFYTTQDPAIAAGEGGYALTKRPNQKSSDAPAPHAYPLYLSIQKPFKIDGWHNPEKFLPALGDTSFKKFEVMSGADIYQRLTKLTGSKKKANEYLKSLGFDGITHPGGNRRARFGTRSFADEGAAKQYAGRIGGEVETSPYTGNVSDALIEEIGALWRLLPDDVRGEFWQSLKEQAKTNPDVQPAISMLRDIQSGSVKGVSVPGVIELGLQFLENPQTENLLAGDFAEQLTLLNDGLEGRVSSIHTVLGHRVWIAFYPEQVKSAIGNRGTFDPSSAKITERRSEAMPERYTGRQLFENAQLTFRPARNRPATLVANDWGGAMLNRLLSEKFDVTTTDANFTIGAKDAKDLRDYLADAKDSGIYEPAQVANMDAMLKQMDAAIADAEANQQDVAFVTRRPAEPISATKAKIRHEAAHLSQSRIAADLSALTGKNWLDSQPNAKDIHKELDRRGYAPETHDYEAAAFVASGDYGVFGMNLDQAAKFLSDYFGAVVEKHGKRALQKFGAINPKLQPTLEAARREIETGQTENQRRSVEAAPRSERRIGAAGEARGSRDSVLARRRESGTGDVGEAGRSPRTRASVENSPEFKRWFGDSKVVDENGKPLVVYHGTNQDFDEFQDTPGRHGQFFGKGYYFALKPTGAESFAYGDNANIIPAYLSIQNPLTVTTGSDAFRKAFSASTPEGITKSAQNGGYDGIIIVSERTGKPLEVIAFSPTQIKSATGNRGTFNPASPRINEMRLNLPQEQGFSVGRLRNEPQGELAASGLGGFQNLFDRKPKAKPARPVEADWDAQKWAKKFYTDSILNALSPEDRAKYSQAKTDKERNAVVLQANLAPDFEAKVFQFIDDATDAFEKGDLQEAGEVVAKGREFMSGQLSDKARDVNWFDHMQSRLSNANFKGTYERLAGQQGKEISELFRNAQVDTATGKISRAEAVRRLRTELKPYVRRVKAAGKPGLARWVEHHIDAVSDPDQSFRGLAGFLKGVQYNTKLRLNPRSAVVNSLQPLQTLWPFVTTSEYNRLWLSAFKKENRTRINEILDREPMGSAEDVSNLGRKLKKIDLFTPVSRHNNRVGFLAGEMFADRKGLTGDAKMRMALDWAKKVEFDNSAYDIPPLFSGKIAGVVGQFKPFMVKNLERIYSDWKSAPPEALATNTWKGAGTLARRSKMVAAQLAIGGVRSAVPGLKMIGGVVILGALAKAFSSAGMDDDKAEKMAEAVYFGAPGLIEQDLSGSVMIFDEPFGKTSYEKMVNFFGGPTLSLIAKGFEEGKNINEAEDTKKSTKAEKQQAAGLRLAKSITPLTKTAIALRAAYKGERPELSLDKKEPMTIPEAIGYGLQGTPLRQTKYWEKKEAPQIVKESKTVTEFLPNFFPRDEEKKGTRVTEKGEVETGMPQQKPGEPDAVYQKRVERVSGWMDEYGQKLLNHPRYQAMPEADQKAAIEALRRRIGAQQNLTRPKLASLEPNAVLLGLQRSKAGKAKREREGKYLYTPQP